MDAMDIVKFYEEDDLSFDYYLNRSIDILININVDKEVNDVNSILTFYNITKYLKDLDDKVKKDYKKQIEYLYKQINRFVKNIDEKNFLIHFRKTNENYIEDFYLLISQNIETLNLSSSLIKKLFNSKRFHILNFLKCKGLVKKYELVLKRYLLKFKMTAEIILDKYTVNMGQSREVYIPDFNEKEVSKIFLNYINDQEANLNYLRKLSNLNPEVFKVNEYVKFQAFKKVEKEEETLFNRGTGIEFGSSVSFGDFKETQSVTKNHNIYTFMYDKKWVEQNLDYPTLLNNFIYLFGFVDRQMRVANVSKKNQMGIFEALTFDNIRGQYKSGMCFNLLQQTALIQMISYNNELEKFGLSIEKCLDWFYSDYLSKEFKISDFFTHIVSSPQNFFEKCRILIPEIDGIIKQYDMYTTYNDIDRKFFEFSTKPVLFEEVKSLNKNKYVYAVKNNIVENIYNFLFSDQNFLSYVPGYKEHDSLYEFITCENIKLDDFGDYQKGCIQWLFDKNILKRDRKGYVKFYNKEEVFIYKELYENGVISFYHFPLKFQKVIKSLKRKGNVEFDDFLFSKDEISYFNYYLNNRNFSNGLSIRNRYGHGTQPLEVKENEHKTNYYFFLYIIVLITIKINDDLCIFDDNRENSKMSKDDNA